MNLSIRFALLLAPLSLLACGDEAPAAGSASAAAKSSAPPAATQSAKPTATASGEASASAPVLPGTPLKDLLKETTTVMVLSKLTGPMGAMTSDKKDIAAIVAAIGGDQKLDKGFGAKCLTPTKIAFQGDKGKQLGMLGFCEGDEGFKSARFDGQGAEMAAVEVKEPEKLKASLKKMGALK